MSIVGKAIWLIESNLTQELGLNGLAEAVEVTPHHLARAFAMTTNQPVMRYVRRRRLTEAAQALAYGTAPITTLALDALYQSPEAFSRAFRAEFGLSPTALRRTKVLDGLPLTQALVPRTTMTKTLSAPRMETFAERRFAGPVRRYDMESRAAIPAQWVAYNTEGRRAETLRPDDYYGVVFNFSDDMATFDYLCGQEVASGLRLPKGLGEVSIAGRYACFACKAHISAMSAAWGEVYSDWLSRPGFRPRRGPSVEYYPPEFNGMTGEGGFEIWVPVED